MLEKDASFTEQEAGLMQVICSVDENDASLNEILFGFMQRIPAFIIYFKLLKMEIGLVKIMFYWIRSKLDWWLYFAKVSAHRNGWAPKRPASPSRHLNRVLWTVGSERCPLDHHAPRIKEDKITSEAGISMSRHLKEALYKICVYITLHV